MTRYVWIRKDVAMALHDAQLAEHGGAAGLRDERMLESALARPENLASYADVDDAALVAAYAFGLVRNHPFVDGNKRTSLVAAEVFLRRNGSMLDSDDATILDRWLRLAAGRLSEPELAVWLRPLLVPRNPLGES